MTLIYKSEDGTSVLPSATSSSQTAQDTQSSKDGGSLPSEPNDARTSDISYHTPLDPSSTISCGPVSSAMPSHCGAATSSADASKSPRRPRLHRGVKQLSENTVATNQAFLTVKSTPSTDWTPLNQSVHAGEGYKQTSSRDLLTSLRRSNYPTSLSDAKWNQRKR